MNIFSDLFITLYYISNKIYSKKNYLKTKSHILRIKIRISEYKTKQKSEDKDPFCRDLYIPANLRMNKRSVWSTISRPSHHHHDAFPRDALPFAHIRSIYFIYHISAHLFALSRSVRA